MAAALHEPAAGGLRAGGPTVRRQILGALRTLATPTRPDAAGFRGRAGPLFGGEADLALTLRSGLAKSAADRFETAPAALTSLRTPATHPVRTVEGLVTMSSLQVSYFSTPRRLRSRPEQGLDTRSARGERLHTVPHPDLPDHVRRGAASRDGRRFAGRAAPASARRSMGRNIFVPSGAVGRRQLDGLVGRQPAVYHAVFVLTHQPGSPPDGGGTTSTSPAASLRLDRARDAPASRTSKSRCVFYYPALTRAAWSTVCTWPRPVLRASAIGCPSPGADPVGMRCVDGRHVAACARPVRPRHPLPAAVRDP